MLILPVYISYRPLCWLSLRDSTQCQTLNTHSLELMNQLVSCYQLVLVCCLLSSLCIYGKFWFSDITRITYQQTRQPLCCWKTICKFSQGFEPATSNLKTTPVHQRNFSESYTLSSTFFDFSWLIVDQIYTRYNRNCECVLQKSLHSLEHYIWWEKKY